MKTIGLLGGMSWESTMIYYREINEGIKKVLGGLHSAKIILNSVDFDIIEKLQHKGDWKETAKILIKEALKIQSGGADFLVICTNTMHKVYNEINETLDIPILHIADTTADAIIKDGVNKVALLGTSFTMEQDFYKGRLEDKYGLNVLTPSKADRNIIHKIIYEELCLGKINESSKQEYIRIIDSLGKQGAKGIILGCTEIGMLINQKDSNIKLFDSTIIHARKAVEYSIADNYKI